MVSEAKHFIKANIPMLVTEKEQGLIALMREKQFGVFESLSFENGQPVGAKRLLENIRF